MPDRGAGVPKGLGAAGKALWAAYTGSFDFDAHELPALELACRQADQVAALEALIAEQGLTVPGSTGQPRLSPAVAEARQGRVALSKLLGELNLPGEGVESEVVSPAQRRARKAATKRWDAVRAREARRLEAVDGGSA